MDSDVRSILNDCELVNEIKEKIKVNGLVGFQSEVSMI